MQAFGNPPSIYPFWWGDGSTLPQGEVPPAPSAMMPENSALGVNSPQAKDACTSFAVSHSQDRSMCDGAGVQRRVSIASSKRSSKHSQGSRKRSAERSKPGGSEAPARGVVPRSGMRSSIGSSLSASSKKSALLVAVGVLPPAHHPPDTSQVPQAHTGRTSESVSSTRNQSTPCVSSDVPYTARSTSGSITETGGVLGQAEAALMSEWAAYFANGVTADAPRLSVDSSTPVTTAQTALPPLLSECGNEQNLQEQGLMFDTLEQEGRFGSLAADAHTDSEFLREGARTIGSGGGLFVRSKEPATQVVPSVRKVVEPLPSSPAPQLERSYCFQARTLLFPGQEPRCGGGGVQLGTSMAPPLRRPVRGKGAGEGQMREVLQRLQLAECGGRVLAEPLRERVGPREGVRTPVRLQGVWCEGRRGPPRHRSGGREAGIASTPREVEVQGRGLFERDEMLQDSTWSPKDVPVHTRLDEVRSRCDFCFCIQVSFSARCCRFLCHVLPVLSAVSVESAVSPGPFGLLNVFGLYADDPSQVAEGHRQW
jgi:hypothetical protein